MLSHPARRNICMCVEQRSFGLYRIADWQELEMLIYLGFGNRWVDRREINLNNMCREGVAGGEVQVAGSYEHCNRYSASIKGRKFLDHFNE